jgi:hypothetical protein
MPEKYDKTAVLTALQQNLENEQIKAVLETLNGLQKEKETEAEAKEPAIKKQFAILVSDPEGKLPAQEFAGWVLQLPETESVATVQERVHRGAHEYNTTRKGRQFPVKTVGEALEQVPPKIFKEADLWVKTKTPVLMLRTDNSIPRNTSE